MVINLENIGRRFNREWIFRDVNSRFEDGHSYAVLGPNGSGKSTFLQIIAGSLSPSAGEINYLENDRIIDSEQYYKSVSLAAPYLELVEEFTLQEHIKFHFRFKTCVRETPEESLVDMLGMHKSKHKLVKYFSSGMKQRLKLVLAFCSDTPVLLLDEPTSNLDRQGVEWYLSLVEEYSQNRLLIISSNQEQEYDFCENVLNIQDYKP